MDFYKRVIELNPNPIYIKDQQGNFILANDAFVKLHGITVSELLKKGVLDLDFSYDRDLEVLASDEMLAVEECYKVDATTYTWFHTVKQTFIQPENGKFLLSVSSDISATKQLLQVAQKQAHLQQKLTAAVQNDLQAPVQAILGMGQLMKQSPLSLEQQEYLDTILSIAAKLLELPAHLLGESARLSNKHTADLNAKGAADEALRQNKLKGLRVLLVEDDPSNLLLTSSLLKSWGVVTDLAYDGLQGFNKALEGAYNLILMDLQLPELGGIEATAKIRTTENPNQHASIIAFTANAHLIGTEEYKQAAFEDYLLKPYKDKQLLQLLLRYALGGQQDQKTENTDNLGASDALYDFSGLGILAEDSDFVKEMQQLFIDTVPAQLDELNGAIEQQNWQATAKIAHRLKTNYGNIKIKRAQEAVKKIEEIAQNKSDFDHLPKLLETLHEVTRKTVTMFSKELQP